jgi:serine/threonine-protein kinase RsbW
MSPRLAREFRGDAARIPEVRAFAEGFAAQAGLGPDLLRRLVLVLEELFTNTAGHGYRTGGGGPVWIALEGGPGALRVVYEDAAPPFDPFAQPAPAGPAPSADGPPGGFGLALVRGLTAARCYERLGGRNRIVLDLAESSRREPPPRA